jgi:hypothetical protein
LLMSEMNLLQYVYLDCNDGTCIPSSSAMILTLHPSTLFLLGSAGNSSVRRLVIKIAETR